MDIFEPFLAKIANPAHRASMAGVLQWIHERFPTLAPVLKWNQPMFTDHGTFIIGFSAAKNHIAVAPEQPALRLFADRIAASGYTATDGLFRIRWEQAVDFELLAAIIQANMQDKAHTDTFWRA